MLKKQKNANVVSEVNAEIATLAPAIANEVPVTTVETPKAEKAAKVPALTEKEKNEIKAAKASKIVSFCTLPAKTVVNFLKEGFTVYPSADGKTIAIKKAIAGVDKLSVKEGNEVQYFFYKNALSTTALTEIFGGAEKIPALQKFGTGNGNYNPFMRVAAEKIPALLAASLNTPYALALFASVEEGQKKAADKAAKTAKIATPTEEG